jgi:hypothetical protein
MSDNVKRIKILRRVDNGREFNYDPMMDGLVRKGILRVIEKHIGENGKLVDEIDLTRLDDDNNEKALREAIARKWPHLVPLIDRPEVARLAADSITGKGRTATARPIEVDGVGEVGDGLPGPDDDDDTPPEEAPKAKKAVKAPKAKALAPEAEHLTTPTAAEMKIAAFADEIMKQPGREGVQAFAAKHGITVELAAKGTMVAEAVAMFTEQVNAVAPKA